MKTASTKQIKCGMGYVTGLIHASDPTKRKEIWERSLALLATAWTTDKRFKRTDARRRSLRAQLLAVLHHAIAGEVVEIDTTTLEQTTR